jgi:pimeloyl-ACP methyl ester carboxylesterase
MQVLTGTDGAVGSGQGAETCSRTTVVHLTVSGQRISNRPPSPRHQAARVRPVAALLAPLTRRLVYPSRATRPAAVDTTLHLAVGDTLLRGWEVNPGRPRGLVYFGGNAESLDRARAGIERGFPEHTGYLLAYRGYGASDGRPSQPALVGDALALHDLVAGRHPGEAVDVIGRSLGSGVAMQLAARRPVGRLVLVTPFDSAAAVGQDHLPRLPMHRLLHDRWDSAAVAADVAARILVLRAGRDRVVRPARTDRLLSALPGRPEVVDLPEADHADLVEDPAYWRAIEEFLPG